MKFFVFKKIKKIDKRFYYLAAFFIFLILAGYFMFGKNGGGLAAIDYGGANANLRGFAWSETAGWISFNAKDCDTNGDGYVDTGNCGGAGNASTPTYNYGVTIATSSTEKGYVYGYAWSSNFGWISFNKKTCQSGIDIGKFCLTSGDCDSSASCLDSANGAIGTPPSAPYNDESNYTAFYDYNTNQLRGWGKALGMGNNGWIRMEDTSDISANGLIFYQSFNYADADWNNKKGLDRSGVSPANDLSFYGVNKPAKGKIGWGLELDGTNYASTAIQNGSQLDIDSNPITMSAWVKIDVLGAGSNSDNRDIIGRGSFAGDGFGINLNGNLINLGRHGGGNFNGNTQVTTNKWYFITGIINGANSKIYINGQLDGTGTVDVKPSAGDLLIGGLSVGATTPYFDGIVDEVRIYNRVLSDDEIMRLYQNGVYLDNNGEFNGWAWSGLKINVCDSGVRAGKECSVDTDCSAFTSGSLCNQQTFDSGIGWMSLNAKNCDTDGNGFVDASSFINSSTAIFENNIQDNLQETNDITSAALPNGNIVISYIDTSYQGKFFIVNRSGSIVKSPTIFSSNIRTSYSSGVPVIPLSNGNFALFFLDNNSTDDGTFMIYGSGGDLIKDKTIFETATINHFSATHLNNGNFLIAYSTLSGLDRFIIYDSLGNIIKNKTPFSFIGSIGFIDAGTFNDGNVLISFYDFNTDNGTFVILDQNGNIVKADTDFDSYGPHSISAVPINNNEMFVAYNEFVNNQEGKYFIVNSLGVITKNSTVFASNFNRGDQVSAALFTNNKILLAYDLAGYSYYSFYDIASGVMSGQVFTGNYNYSSTLLSSNNKYFYMYIDSGKGYYGLMFGCGGDNAFTPITNYKVYTTDPYLLNSPPLAIALSSPNWTYSQACEYGALNAQLQWEFFDLDNPTQTAYEIVITQDNNTLPDPNDPDSINNGSNFPLNTSRIPGGAISFWPQNNSYRNVSLSYNKKYYWWVRVWDNLDEPSKWIQYNTSIDNPVVADNGDPLSFTTYKHEFPDAYFKWFPLVPSKDEETLFYDISNYYTDANPNSNAIACFNSATGAVSCGYKWVTSSDFSTIIDLSTITASSTKIKFGQAKTSQTVTMDVSDRPEGYTCSISTVFGTNVKLPLWKEVPYIY